MSIPSYREEFGLGEALGTGFESGIGKGIEAEIERRKLQFQTESKSLSKRLTPQEREELRNIMLEHKKLIEKGNLGHSLESYLPKALKSNEYLGDAQSMDTLSQKYFGMLSKLQFSGRLNLSEFEELKKSIVSSNNRDAENAGALNSLALQFGVPDIYVEPKTYSAGGAKTPIKEAAVQQEQQPQQQSSFDLKELPNPANYKGEKIEKDNGQILVSDGKRWIPQKGKK